MSAPARGSCSADVGYDDHHHCHTLFRILENDDCFRRQGPDAAGCFLGGKALRLPSLPPFAGFFFFFFFGTPAAKFGRVSWTEVLKAAASLRRAVLVTAATASPTQAHCRKQQQQQQQHGALGDLPGPLPPLPPDPSHCRVANPQG